MKPITIDDLTVGANLLCVKDTDKYFNWLGEEATITDIDGRACWVEVKSTGDRQNLHKDTLLISHNRIIFVNYDKMTDKEKFLFHMTGKVNLE